MCKIKKQIAKTYGYTMWYDRALRLWTLTQDGRETLYFPPLILKNMTAATLISQLSSESVNFNDFSTDS